MATGINHAILIVDDEAAVMNSLRRLLRRECFDIHTAMNGSDALELIRKAKTPFSLIISDQQMPEMTGIQFLAEARKILPDTMRILLTGYSDMEVIIEAINNGGIHRYMTKPWNDEDMLLQVRQMIGQHELILENRRLMALTKSQNEELILFNNNLEETVREKTVEIINGEKALHESYRMLEKAFESAIEAMSTIVEVKDNYTYGHQKNVAKIACDISEEMGLAEGQRCAIRMSAIVHDIGKIALPAEILSKPTKLNEMEMGMIRTHPEIGFRILEKIAFPHPVARIVYQHHERMNGSGYPEGLSGDGILLEARILGVADVVDAIASHRPYRPALGLKEAMREITHNKGILYDPQVVAVCAGLFGERDYGLVKE